MASSHANNDKMKEDAEKAERMIADLHGERVNSLPMQDRDNAPTTSLRHIDIPQANTAVSCRYQAFAKQETATSLENGGIESIASGQLHRINAADQHQSNQHNRSHHESKNQNWGSNRQSVPSWRPSNHQNANIHSHGTPRQSFSTSAYATNKPNVAMPPMGHRRPAKQGRGHYSNQPTKATNRNTPFGSKPRKSQEHVRAIPISSAVKKVKNILEDPESLGQVFEAEAHFYTMALPLDGYLTVDRQLDGYMLGRVIVPGRTQVFDFRTLSILERKGRQFLTDLILPNIQQSDKTLFGAIFVTNANANNFQCLVDKTTIPGNDGLRVPIGTSGSNIPLRISGPENVPRNNSLKNHPGNSGLKNLPGNEGLKKLPGDGIPETGVGNICINDSEDLISFAWDKHQEILTTASATPLGEIAAQKHFGDQNISFISATKSKSDDYEGGGGHKQMLQDEGGVSHSGVSHMAGVYLPLESIDTPLGQPREVSQVVQGGAAAQKTITTTEAQTQSRIVPAALIAGVASGNQMKGLSNSMHATQHTFQTQTHVAQPVLASKPNKGLAGSVHANQYIAPQVAQGGAVIQTTVTTTGTQTQAPIAQPAPAGNLNKGLPSSMHSNQYTPQVAQGVVAVQPAVTAINTQAQAPVAQPAPAIDTHAQAPVAQLAPAIVARPNKGLSGSRHANNSNTFASQKIGFGLSGSMFAPKRN